MASLEEIREGRLAKLEKLKKAGMDPYPITSERTESLKEIRNSFTEGEEKVAAGRITALRGQGGLLFVDLYDGTGSFQVLVKEDEMDARLFELFSETTDIGDFIETKGNLFTTKRGEQSVVAKDWKMLAKSLRPLPEKWHGLKDAEERYRRRYLDLIANEDVRKRFETRSDIVREVRNLLHDAGYVEVETPMLQPLAGGATARPFVTHHNALDIDLFLRIAPELYLKRMLVSGMPKVFELNRNFRNEGIDVTHNPEFTMLEYYEAYSDKNKQMTFIEELLRNLSERVNDGQTFTFEDTEIDLAPDFAVMTFAGLFSDHLGIEDITKQSRDELEALAKEKGVDVSNEDGPEKIMDTLYKKLIRPKLIQPIFITDYPENYLPLAKKLPEHDGLVDAFQLVVGGVELVKAFSELNDPVDQKGRFEVQEEDRKRGDDEAQQMDIDYIEAMEHGMPPAGGVGIGIDRLVMLFTNTHNIREVILFPTLRPKEEGKKDKTTKIGVVVLNHEAFKENWQKLNTVAHLTAAFGARSNESLFVQNDVVSEDGVHIPLNIRHALMIKDGNQKDIQSVFKEANSKGLHTELFTEEMLSTTNDKKVTEMTAQKNFDDISILGGLVFGEREVVEELTKHLGLSK